MTSRLILTGIGSAAIVAVFDGAVRALTATPPALALCAGAFVVIVSMRRDARLVSALAALAGAFAGLCLPLAAESQPRDVGTHAPRGHIAADLFEALDRLDADPSAFDSQDITISGTWTPASAAGAATVSRRVMSCCAADAVDVGFDVAPRADPHVRPGTWVQVSGRVFVRLRAGELRYEIDSTEVRPASR